MKYTIAGFKAFAIALLGFKYLQKYFQSMETEEPKIGGFIEVLGTGMIIISADWIINLIESVFAVVESNITTQTVPYNTDIFTNTMLELDSLTDGCTGLDCISAWLDGAIAYALVIVFYILYSILWMLDNLVYAFYLIERIFLIEVMRFVFPLAIVFSQLDGTKDFFYRWIKKYIGILILPIPYIAIFSLTNIIMDQTANIQVGFDWQDGFTRKMLFYIGSLGISFFLKLKLFSGTKRLMDNLFN